MAWKCEGKSEPTQKHMDTLVRGGLWKVTSAMIVIFNFAEVYFLQSTEDVSNKIDSKSIVSKLLMNS